ncbi:sensor histidine kinase KdpD [Nostocoides sp. HKS02]|uniref:sensor histidine kinase n=1 Tax=Nostocoides sp. HKS02 TaxID=1813880 RepID=UPI0018A8373C|nr:HAMP domain-containing sensor histidine kinase [Tetrasphaera sp. HKS02]
MARWSAAPWHRVLATALAVLGGVFGLTQLETIEGWVWGAVVGALACAVFAAGSYVLNARHRRSLEVLLVQARQLGDLSPASQDVEPPTDGLAAEVSAAMGLSALRLRTQLAQERAFSGQAAHQLRTPLTALGLQLDELTMDPETPRRVRAAVHRSRNEVDRLAEIIADLLALARRGALPTGRYQTDPAVVAVHATHRWASLARAAGRELRVAGTLPDCQVPAPAGPTSQVLDVLIDNALKHGSGDIEVSVRVMADSVRLRVADQGTSVRPAAGQHATAGAGMGLDVAEKLAAACGGRMVRAPIPTTAFDLVLPREDPVTSRQ